MKKKTAASKTKPANFLKLLFLLVVSAVVLIVYLYKSGILQKLTIDQSIISDTNAVINCPDLQCVWQTMHYSQESQYNPKHWGYESGIYWATKQPLTIGNYILSDGHYYLLDHADMSLMQVQRFHLPDHDLFTFAKEESQGDLKKLDINGYTSYIESPRFENPFFNRNLNFYGKEVTHGVSYHVFTRDLHDNIYKISIYIDDRFPDSAKVYAGMVKTLEFSRLSGTTIDAALKYNDPLLHFTGSIGEKIYCFGQDVPIPFEVLRTPAYHSPVSMDLALMNSMGQQVGGTVAVVENKLPLKMYDAQDSLNQTYHWTAGKSVDNKKIKPGQTYALELSVHYDNGDLALIISDQFTLADCSK